MGDISSPSSCMDSFITPFLRSFSTSLIKKDSYLNENFMSIGYFLRERSSSQISNGILDKVERTYQRHVHSDNLVEINLQKKKLPSESDFFWNLTWLVVFLKANWCSPIWKPWLAGLVNKFLFCVLGLGHISFYNLLIAMFASMFAFKLETFTAWKVSVFGVILVCIFPRLDWIRRFGWIRILNTDFWLPLVVTSHNVKETLSQPCVSGFVALAKD